MTGELALGPSRRAIRCLDAAVVFLVLVFVAVGVLAAVELSRLAGFSVSLLDAATALDQVGQSLAGLTRVPFVGHDIGSVAGRVHQTAASTRANAMEAAAAVHALAVIIGVAVATAPLGPLLVGYLPLRLVRSRQLHRLRRLLTTSPTDEQLVAYLAHHAASRLPYAQLCQLAHDPWADLRAGRHYKLAAAELRRLGIVPPPGWPVTELPVVGRGAPRGR